MKITILTVIALISMLMITGVASAAWPAGSQGDQYAAVNSAMVAATAAAGISPDSFVAIYNDALAGSSAGYSDAQLAAACQVVNDLSAYSNVLGSDYDTVYSALGCGSRDAAPGPSRASLPSTGIAFLLLAGSGLVGTGAAIQMFRKSRKK